MTDITMTGTMAPDYDTILSDDALAFIADLHHRFDATRKGLLA